MNIRIDSRNVGMTPRWSAEIARRISDLQTGHNDLTHARVTLTKNRHHKKDARIADAVVILTLPRRHTMTARKQDKTFEEAIRAAFDAVTTELEKYRAKLSGRRGHKPMPMSLAL